MICRLHARHRAIEFKKFLQAIDREVPDDLAVHLALDNSSTHKTPAIQRWLAAHPRLVVHFTPTSSSWLNLVERWFAELTTKKLRRGAHRSVRQLSTDIRAWIETWNTNPNPFVWTKSADETSTRSPATATESTCHDTSAMRDFRQSAGASAGFRLCLAAAARPLLAAGHRECRCSQVVRRAARARPRRARRACTRRSRR